MEQQMMPPAGPPTPPGVVVTPPAGPPAAPMMADGGPVPSSSPLKGINWVEVLVVVFFGIGIVQLGIYFRYKIKNYKKETTENTADIKQMQARLSALEDSSSGSDSYDRVLNIV